MKRTLTKIFKLATKKKCGYSNISRTFSLSNNCSFQLTETAVLCV